MAFGKRLGAANPKPAAPVHRQARPGPVVPPIVANADLTGLRKDNAPLEAAPLALVVRAYGDL